MYGNNPLAKPLALYFMPNQDQGFSNQNGTTVLIKNANSTNNNTKFYQQLFKLSNKQAEVLMHLTEVDNQKIIAQKMHISPETVKSHLQIIFAKTHTHNCKQLLQLVFKLQL